MLERGNPTAKFTTTKNLSLCEFEKKKKEKYIGMIFVFKQKYKFTEKNC